MAGRVRKGVMGVQSVLPARSCRETKFYGVCSYKLPLRARSGPSNSVDLLKTIKVVRGRGVDYRFAGDNPDIIVSPSSGECFP